MGLSRILWVALSSLLIMACSQSSTVAPDNFELVYQGINEAPLKSHTRTLASDKFEGRQPTTAGERKTIAYLTKTFEHLGYQPGNGGSYLQPVQLLQVTANPNMQLQLGSETLDYGTDMIALSQREQTQVSLTNSEVVFVGYGVNAPEYDWNDYAGLDVKGKTVLILVNDPGFADPDSGKFQGKTMTYYGRWSYKYEEASRQGAAAAFIIHETAPASYGWSVVANSWSGPQYGLVTDNGNADRVAVEGWLSLGAAKKVLSNAGYDFAALKQQAVAGPTQQPIGISASVEIQSTLQTSASHNVIATLPGSKYPDEHIIYTAHWDHLGTDASKDGDNIYNGAHDNATGTAALLTLAESFSQLNQRPERSVTFLIVTAEEQGLLGSKYYAEHPIIPLKNTVANLNMDAANVLGRTKDVAVVGYGKSELEQYLERAAKRQGRYITQEDRPEAGYYYRSDHFSFAKVGVPALYAEGGSEPVDAATADYRKRTSVIITGCYHQVCDQLRENWDFGGVVEDTQLYFQIGHELANNRDWPKWLPGAEFSRQ